jgi:hypothetical protein
MASSTPDMGSGSVRVIRMVEELPSLGVNGKTLERAREGRIF